MFGSPSEIFILVESALAFAFSSRSMSLLAGFRLFRSSRCQSQMVCGCNRKGGKKEMYVKKHPVERVAGLVFFGSACVVMAVLVIAVPGISLTQRILLALGSCFFLLGASDAFVPARMVIHSPRWREGLGELGRIIFGAGLMQAPVTKLVGGLIWSLADWTIAASALVLISHGIYAIMRMRERFLRPSR
jgi:hypothetical protein